MRATEAIAWTSIFPYVYDMVRSMDEVDDAQIPYYAGLLISVYTFAEFLSGILWAKVSDHICRRATLLIGSVCGMTTAISFGFSRSIAFATAARAFGGLFNPNVGIVQTCVAESVHHKEQQVKAFSFVTFIRTLGNLIGPILGGFLANPVLLYPSLFPQHSVWAEYKFLLPNLVVASLQVISFATAFLFLLETHQGMLKRSGLGLEIGSRIVRCIMGKCTGQPSRGESSGYVPLENIPADVELQDIHAEEDYESRSAPQPTPWMKIPSKQSLLQILAVGLLAFHKVSSDALMPAFLAAPTALPHDSTSSHERSPFDPAGGFGYSSHQVGLILLSQAIVAVIMQATVVPLAVGKLGALKAYRIAVGIYPTMYVLTPFLPNLESPLPTLLVTLDLWAKVLLSSVGYICSAILITNTTADKGDLAFVNGASASFSCLTRSAGPLITGKLFALGLRAGFPFIAFWTLGLVALIEFVESFMLVEHS
ncbi:major facilitator superfamily domain-containing protein [Stachybotrys elegans]|uniref:Major facilitator superfamily domain-containing protein n=1 Tax=Stachybotrys elegans TaxID=80388 RepID=A0A8K0WMQ2_9HYPO|nr:major facilitator superfamily domain-containing protein [Stachybotrys elegans]